MISLLELSCLRQQYSASFYLVVYSTHDVQTEESLGCEKWYFKSSLYAKNYILGICLDAVVIHAVRSNRDF